MADQDQPEDQDQALNQDDDDSTGGEILSSSEHGTAASHPERLLQSLLVAPTTAAAFNTLSLDLVPVACLSLHDLLFEFDSSFPLPTVAVMLKELPGLRETHKNALGQPPPASIFGHADPVGTDVYNKLLSGRRARAIYGLLINDVAVWDKLFNEEWHSKSALQTMREATGLPAGTSRPTLMKAYQTLLFPSKLAKSDFLGKGSDPQGKADFQGCSEFNPLVILSADENTNLPKAKRESENQPNRRVVIFLFRPGLILNPKLWPCPVAEDSSTQACKQRFFGPPKTGEMRRQAGAARREFAKTNDTFACRFYDRVARLSPCENPGPVSGRVRPFIFFEELVLSDAPVDAGEAVPAKATAGAPAGPAPVGPAPAPPAPAPPAPAPAAPAAPAPAAPPPPAPGAPAPAAAPVKAPAPPKPPPAAPPVVPGVTSGGVVVMKKKHTNPARVPVLLKTDKVFTGRGTFTAAPPDTILFFTAKKGGKAITFVGKENVFPGAALTKGVTLFAEAAKVSGNFNDVTITLNLAGGAQKITNNPKQSKMTAIDVSLQICKPRKTAGADPPTLSEAEKIEPGRALHVQNPASTHLRPMLIVGPVKPAGFKGKLVLTTENTGKGSVVLFTNEKQTAAETAANELDIPVAGKKVFVEGIGVSGKVKDTKVKLGIAGGETDADHVILTVIEAKLDIFKSREKAGKARDPLPDKVNIGRFIHIQDTTATKRKHRALIIVHQVKPAGFVGKLVLTPVESLATPAAPAKVSLFAAEDPASAGAALGMPLQLDHGTKFPADGERRFAEGATVSTTSGDSGFVLGVKDVEDECDRVTITVYQVLKVDVALAKTRCRRAVAGDHTPVKSSTTDTLTFDAATPTVVRGCGDLKMDATVKPATVTLTWDVSRATDDDNSLKGLPTHAVNGGDKKRKVTCDATGSFHVFAFVDGNGNGKHSDDEDGVVVNLNMVEIKIPAGPPNNKIFRNPNYTNAGSTATSLRVDSALSLGTFNVAPGINGNYGEEQFQLHLIGFQVKVNLIGGGPVKRRGVTKLLLGYIQTTTPSDTIVGTYADGRTEKETPFVQPIPPVSIVAGRVVKNPPAPAPPLAKLAFPIRDTTAGLAGASGTSPFLFSSSDANPADKKNLPAGGEQRVVRCVDSPVIGLDLTHPVTGSALASIAGSNNFEDFLVAVSTDFNENYTAFAQAIWNTTYGTFTAAGGWTNAGAGLGPLPLAVAMTVLSPPVEGDKAAFERCQPNFVDVIPLDAR